jgi:hypothetical protein
VTWREERERLLRSRISDLDLRIEGSGLEPLIRRLNDELDRAGLQFKPPIYLTDEWGCPEGVPIIGVPFYLAKPELAQIEKEIAENLETAEESMKYLRHEAGHAFNYAYVLYEDEEWHRIFGPYSRPYMDNFRPNPFSREYVRHIATRSAITTLIATTPRACRSRAGLTAISSSFSRRRRAQDARPPSRSCAEIGSMSSMKCRTGQVCR